MVGSGPFLRVHPGVAAANWLLGMRKKMTATVLRGARRGGPASTVTVPCSIVIRKMHISPPLDSYSQFHPPLPPPPLQTLGFPSLPFNCPSLLTLNKRFHLLETGSVVVHLATGNVLSFSAVNDLVFHNCDFNVCKGHWLKRGHISKPAPFTKEDPTGQLGVQQQSRPQGFVQQGVPAPGAFPQAFPQGTTGAGSAPPAANPYRPGIAASQQLVPNGGQTFPGSSGRGSRADSRSLILRYCSQTEIQEFLFPTSTTHVSCQHSRAFHNTPAVGIGSLDDVLSSMCMCSRSR